MALLQYLRCIIKKQPSFRAIAGKYCYIVLDFFIMGESLFEKLFDLGGRIQ